MQRGKSTSSGTTSEAPFGSAATKISAGVRESVASGDRPADRPADRGRTARKKPAAIEDEQARQLLAESSKLYYRIGEVSELTGVKAHVLRYWETEFRWMAPPKSRSKQRLYRKRDIEFVWLLKKLLWAQRYTIAGARQRIQELGLDEALARNADAESLDQSLEQVLAISFEGVGADAAAGDDHRLRSTAALPNDAGDSAARRDGAGGGDWLGVRVALESMQGELLALRGVLQQGL